MTAPIETRYNGYHFRSRLEARWAVFFDAAGITYRYEPEGYVLDDGSRYLPDFFLPGIGIYVEVKGDGLRSALPKLISAAESLPEHPTRAHKFHEVKIMLLGDVPAPHRTAPSHPVLTDLGYWADCYFGKGGRFKESEGYDSGEWGLFQGDLYGCEDFGILERWDTVPSFTRNSGVLLPELQAAYRAARSARFEFGQTPKGPRA